jgi:outer membrane protein assembly factor BamB
MSAQRICVWGLVALIVPLAAGEADLVPAEALHESGLVKFWQLRLPLEPEQRLTDAYLVDDQLYLPTQDGYVFAVHADSGAVRWLRPVTRAGYRIKRPCHAGGRVVFVTPSRVLQLDRVLGDGIAQAELWFPAGTAGTSDGLDLYLGGINGRFYALNVLTQMERWKAGMQGAITSTPVLHEDKLFVASNDGHVSACVAENKRYRWQASVSGPIVADLASDANGLYVACQDQSLYLFDTRFGQIRWRARFSGPLYEPPVLTSEVAYQFCPEDGLVAVNTSWIGGVEQRFRWKLPHGRQLLTVDKRFAYVLSRDESILVVRLEDGKIDHEIPAPGFTMGMPAPGSTTLWMAGADGRVFCARPRGVPFVRREDLRRALLPPEVLAEVEEAAPEATKPGQQEVEDYLRGAATGPPIGGKSKVSKQFESGAAGGGGEAP